MPRLSLSLLRRARAAHPLLPLLLPTCRNLHDARNELRWLTECAERTEKRLRLSRPARPARLNGISRILLSMVRRRATGIPLQYVLRSQPFGDLDILCRHGVLIPRPETEAYTYQTAHLISSALSHGASTEIQHLRLIDLCTGTGCIPLLLHSLLSPSLGSCSLSIDAIDIDDAALQLARRNISHNIHLNLLHPRARDEIALHAASVFNLPALAAGSRAPPWLVPAREGELIVLTSNPPYISPTAYRDGTTARSVRLFEPKKALVPPVQNAGEGIEQADLFYRPIIEVSKLIAAHLTVLECGDPAQARRVARLAANVDADGAAQVEVWRCDGKGTPIACHNEKSRFNGFDMRWCTVADDAAETKEKGARIVVVKRPPFSPISSTQQEMMKTG